MAGQLDRLISDFLYPLPIFLPNSRLVVHTPDLARDIFHCLHVALVKHGVVALRPAISAIDLPRAGRFRVWVDCHEVALPVEASRISQIVYYCQQTDLGLRIEMINYSHLSIPDLNRQFEALALNA